MDASHQVLLDLLDQVGRDPDVIPEVHAERFPDGSSERRLLEAFQDMLGRIHQSRQDLRARYEELVNSIDGIVWEADAHTVEFSFVSQQAERLLGYPTSRWLTEPSFWQDHIDPEDRSWVVPFCSAATAEKRAHEFEYRMIAADGRAVWLRDIVTVVVENDQPARLRGVMVDITERKRTEEALARLRRQHELILDAAGEGIYGVDRDGLSTFVNPAAARMLGWEPDDLIGKPGHMIVHHSQPDGTDYPPEACPVYAAALRDGVVHTSDGEVFWRKDGTSFPVEYISTPIWERGEIVGAVITFRDITKRKHAEEQLHSSEAELRALFAAMRDTVLVLDAEGRYLKVASHTPELLAQPTADLIGRRLHDVFPSAQADDFLAHVRMALASGECVEHEYSVALESGERWFAAAISRMDDRWVVLVARDISERKQTEERLREKEEEYRSIFESTSDGLVINDRETGAVVAVNPAFAQMHGYSVEELVGLHPTTFIHSDYHHLFIEYLEAVRAGREFRAQAVDIRKDGTPFPVEVHGTGFTYMGKPHCLGVVRDITERVQTYQLLEQRVQERTRELSTLLEVSQNVASTLELQPLLSLILDQLRVLAEYHGAAVSILEGETLVVAAYRGPLPQEQAVGLRRPARRSELIWKRLEARECVVIGDIQGEGVLERAYRRYFSEHVSTTLKDHASTLLVPLVAREQVIGFLGLYHRQPNYYTDHHARLIMATANQAAVAIQNARLYERAQELAALEERQRLARELHDSVSQALYGIALGTRTARTLFERQESGVAEALEYVGSLAAAGMAEMRALIFELRPESLETEGLVAALTKQAASLQARHRIEVRTALPPEPALPIEIKEVLYRIAQEALHNTVKHAQARQVHLHLAATADCVVLDVHDDGVGFDPNGSFPGHLGLRSMRERVARFGGRFSIESAPGNGTSIHVQIPCDRAQTEHGA